jgi:hypothetical protein
MKKLLVVSDLHCGHTVGLSPPCRHTNTKRRHLWNLYVDILNEIGDIDILVCNGDAIEGKGERAGGSEVEEDMNDQVEMATECLLMAGADEVYMTFGTPYHTGKATDYEKFIAANLGADIRDMLELSIEGVNFNFKHKISGSTIPHGRFTPIAREKLWNILWNEYEVQQKAAVIVRSHVHYYALAGGHNWIGFITPSLKGLGDKFGSRQCINTVDFGALLFEIDDGSFTFKPFLKYLKGQISSPIIIP